jgi:hypothetical protein
MEALDLLCLEPMLTTAGRRLYSPSLTSLALPQPWAQTLDDPTTLEEQRIALHSGLISNTLLQPLPHSHGIPPLFLPRLYRLLHRKLLDHA